MPSFSNKDIEEAKRRVREMQSRADSYVSTGKGTNNIKSEKKNTVPPQQKSEKEKEKAKPVQNDNTEDGDNDNSLFSENSSFIILVLLMLLSHEGADNKLLLALLYLLL